MTRFSQIGILWLLLVLLEVVRCQSDDFTNIYYFGCRWYGGMANAISCSCSPEAQEMYVRENSIPNFDLVTLEISDCPQVRFGSNSVKGLRNLRNIILNNIKSLTFESNSINWIGYRDSNPTQEERFDLSTPSLKISIKDSRIDRIESYSFTGRINDIRFDNVEIVSVAPFAFCNLQQVENLHFQNVVFKDVKPQAFKKFSTEFLTLDGVIADNLPSRTFANVTVYRNFVVRNSRFRTLQPGTFIVNNPINFQVINNQVNQFEGESFIVTTTGDVIFRNNQFDNVQDHAFMGITTEMGSRTITFDSNTFGTVDSHTWNVQPQFEARISNLNLNQSCDCNTIVNNLPNEFYGEILCLLDDQYITVKDYKINECSVFTGYYTLIISIGLAFVVICLIAIAFYLYYSIVYKRQKYGCKKGGKPPLSLIVPDGRTYKETELHVIVEKADLLTTDL